MPTIDEVRQQYPQYNDMSDTALADALHQKFYADMPKAQFNKKIGHDPDQVPIGTTGVQDIGRGTALGVGALQGVTGNFGDEISGVLAAGSPVSGDSLPAKAIDYATSALPTSAIPKFGVGAAKLLYEKLAGKNDPNLSSLITGESPKGGATQKYEEARDYVRDQARAAQEQYPGTYIAGNVGGAIASPISRLIRAPAALGPAASFADRMRQAIPYGVKTGATYGAVSGAGEGETLAERATNAAEGGVIGGAIGGATPPVAEGAIQLGRAATAPIRSAIRGIRDPEGEAARRAITALERDVAADPQAAARLTPQEFTQNVQTGGPASLVDMGGETTKALARSSANTSPEGRAVLSQSINDRFEQQAPRMAEWFNNTFNYATPQAREQAIKNVAQNVYEPKYAQAYKAVASRDLWDKDLESLAQAPEVQRAIRTAMVNARNWAVRDGLKPPVGAFVIDNSGTVPRTVLKQTQAGNQYRPSLQLWDYVKRALDRSGDPPSQDLARTLREHIDTLVPEYKAARAASQPTKFFEGAKNAYEAGQNFINKGQQYGVDAQKQIARMNPDERKLFQDGYTSAMVEKIERTPDRRNILNTIAATPAARQEIETALGSQRWRQLEATLRVEGIMDLARPAVQGNSTTARQLMELGLAGGAGGFEYMMNGDPSAAMHAALIWGAARGQRGIDSRVARQVANLLTSNNPQAFQRGVQMVARNNQLLNQIRRVDGALSRIGIEQAPRPALSLPGTARPEDDQPNVPRPPSR